MTVPSVPGIGRRTALSTGVTAALAVGVATVSHASAPTPAGGAPPRTRLRAPFTLGVASGDPESDGFVLWTRLAPRPLEPDGRGGMPDREVVVEWQVATDPGFRDPVRGGAVRARPRSAHAVHVEVAGLEPGREYFYRFRAEGHLSPTGRTRTAPPYRSSPTSLTVAVASCAQYEHGFFTGYRRLAEEQPELVLHLGDYLYEMRRDEYVAHGGNVRDHRGPDTVTLAGYRQRHAQYKTDADLQAAHAAAPWSVIWDDHEVAGNWAGLVPQEPEPHFGRRRAAAFRAYYEHMPLRRASVPRGPDMRIYRRLRWGDLATFHLLDTRQYRDDQACGDRRLVGCTERLGPDRSILGDRQERWLLDGLAGSGSHWDVVAQQVFMAQKDTAEGSPVQLAMDGWDGYPASRRRLLDGFVDRRVRNPVVLTGDTHGHYANDLHRDPDDVRSRPVGVELATTSISSGGDGVDRTPRDLELLEQNPHIRFVNSQRGYILARLGREHLRADFRVLPYVRRPGAPVRTRASYVVEDRGHRLVPD